MTLELYKNTFVILEEADAYFDERFGSDKWTDESQKINNETKEKLLITASRKISALDFVGSPLDVGSFYGIYNRVFYRQYNTFYYWCGNSGQRQRLVCRCRRGIGAEFRRAGTGDRAYIGEHRHKSAGIGIQLVRFVLWREQFCYRQYSGQQHGKYRFDFRCRIVAGRSDLFQASGGLAGYDFFAGAGRIFDAVVSFRCRYARRGQGLWQNWRGDTSGAVRCLQLCTLQKER